MLVSRLVLKICRVKPNALRDLELWRVGFRYIYLLEQFIEHQSCVYNRRVFGLLPLYLAETPKQKHLRVHFYFYYRTYV